MADAEEVEINHHTRASEIVSIFKALSAGPNKHIAQAWAGLLDAEISSDEYYIALGAISRSLAALHDEIDNSGLRYASKQMYLGAASSFQQYLEVTRIQSLTTDNLKNETDSFRLLTLLDDVLQPNAHRDMPKASLKQWTATVDDLIESAEEAIKDATLRAFVIRQLHHLRWAIGNYRFIGIDGISRAYGSMAAEIARSQNMKGGQTEEARSWFQKAKKPIIAIGVAIAASSAVVEQADNLIEHGGNIYEAIMHHGGDAEPAGKEKSEDKK
ncbi:MULTISPECIES: hypothetical protein [unclassified Sphingomonas]|uniref:hypothetical protein n=1 Tax=unclassified Sphingomonas TaxID=196159 RepID=UPI00285BD710|nr:MULTISPECIES: hypothetical protein [unclassified Sphingomonas]MDR6115799.1 hypothetical protein [Sphingomonas sp. SORGH_AS_0789]MDR6150530.1 hypothetical protein [Sphingomonas sp. SORGH_AS_0742]